MNNKNNQYGYFTEGVYYKNGTGEVYTSDIFITFFQKLNLNKEITALGRLAKQEFSPKYQLKKDINFVSISYYKSLRSLIITLPFYILRNAKKIILFIQRIDLLFVSASGPISILLLWLMKIKRKKNFLFIRQDTRELIKAKYHDSFIPKLIANWIESSIEKIVKKNNNVTIFTFGDDIFSRYSKISNFVIPVADSRFENSQIISPIELFTNKESYKNLLYVGRLAKGKGLEFLIETLYELPIKKFKLTIIGDGNIKNDLISLVKKLNLIEKVVFKGYIPFGKRLLKEYSSNDVLIFPSFSEGLPQVVLEAMARGVIVIATRVGGLTNLIKDGENGFLFEPGDKKGLLKIIREIQTNELPLLTIRKNGINTAKKYSFEKQATKIYKALKMMNS
jgi:glycosyltransferase involved in cell wall biosynthesis